MCKFREGDDEKVSAAITVYSEGERWRIIAPEMTHVNSFCPHYLFAGHLMKYYCLSQAKDCTMCNTVLIDVHHHSM